jgi:hypothetical protein
MTAFSRRFRWSDYVPFLDGTAARLAYAVPLVGYLIVFNDTISDFFHFKNLTRAQSDSGFLSSNSRLHLIYYGMIFLGLANLGYRLFRPKLHQLGTDRWTFVDRAMAAYTMHDFMRLHERFKLGGTSTEYGEYSDAEWLSFWTQATGTETYKPNVTKHRGGGTWNAAKSKHEGLMRSMLVEFYAQEDIKRPVVLGALLAFAFLGYALLAIPSIELFVRVTLATFKW